MINFDRSDIKMSVLNTDFYFNGENVTCEVTVTLKAPDLLMKFLVDDYDPFFDLGNYSRWKVKGTAKCHPDDEFDIEKGKKIAQAKAEAKAYLQLRTYVLNKWNTLLDIIEAAAPLKDKFVDKAEGCHTHNEEYISRISNSNVF